MGITHVSSCNWIMEIVILESDIILLIRFKSLVNPDFIREIDMGHRVLFYNITRSGDGCVWTDEYSSQRHQSNSLANLLLYYMNRKAPRHSVINYRLSEWTHAWVFLSYWPGMEFDNRYWWTLVDQIWRSMPNTVQGHGQRVRECEATSGTLACYYSNLYCKWLWGCQGDASFYSSCIRKIDLVDVSYYHCLGHLSDPNTFQSSIFPLREHKMFKYSLHYWMVLSHATYIWIWMTNGLALTYKSSSPTV